MELTNIDINYISNFLPDEIAYPVGCITGVLRVNGKIDAPAIERNLQLPGEIRLAVGYPF